MTTSRVAAALLPLLFVLGSPTPAAAQSAAERAAQLNEEGKKLWQEKSDLAGAVEKFRQATVLSPEGRYYFNLCYALHQLGQYREALTACRAVEPNGADADVLKKTAVVIEDLEKRVPPEEQDTGEGGTGEGTGTGEGDTGTGEGDTGTGEGTPPGDPPPGYEGQPGGGEPAPLPGLEQAAPPTDEYSWSLGADLGFVASSVGRADYYSGAAATLKLHASFVIVPKLNIGAQGYIGITQIGAGSMAQYDLSIVDFGGALYKHLRRERFYLTPLVGVQLTGMQPANGLEDVPVTLGLRGELAFSWILGPLRNHVLSVTPAINLYAAAEQPDVAVYGLDQSSATVGVTVGYTLRFMEPFGQSPLIILE
jgi:tetratricopeptide (TPR) repeat protein